MAVGALLFAAPVISPLLDPPGSITVFADARYLVEPEPEELTRYLLAVAAPAVLAGLLLLRGRPLALRSGALIVCSQLALLALVVWCLVVRAEAPTELPASFGQDPRVFTDWDLAVAAAIAVGLVALVLRPPEWLVSRLDGKEHSRSRFLAMGVAALLTAIWLLPAILPEQSLGTAEPLVQQHVPLQVNDYWAVLNGHTPLGGYVTHYASLIPFVVAPVMSLLGPSVTSFTVVMTLLSLAGLLAIYGSFVLVSGRTWPAVCLYVPFLAFALTPATRHDADWTFNANLFSIMPSRYLGPFVVAFLCARLLAGRGRRPWVVLAAAALAALNNPEFGLPCVGAALTALWLGWNTSTAPARRARDLAIHAGAGFLLAIALVCAAVLTRAGTLSHLGDLFLYSRMFGREGFGTLPMPELGLHILAYLTFSACLITAAARSTSRADGAALTGMLGFAGVFGLGAGVYFAARSVTINLIVLFPAWGFAIALLALVVVPALSSASAARRRLLLIPATMVLFAVGLMVASIRHFPAPWNQVDRIASSTSEGTLDTEAEERFVSARTEPGERALVLAPPNHAIAERSGVVDVNPFYAPSIYTFEQMDRVLDEARAEHVCAAFTQDVHREENEELASAGFERVDRDAASGMGLWLRRAEECEEGPGDAAGQRRNTTR